MSNSALRSFCFTKQLESPSFEHIFFHPALMKYMVYQLERASTGQYHLQGYVQLKTRKRFGPCKKMIGGNPHIEPARGTPTQASEYCKKSESRVDGPWEFGELSESGDSLHKEVVSYMSKVTKFSSLLSHERYGKYCATRMNWARTLFESIQNERISSVNFEYRPWQIDLVCTICRFDTRRTVWWVVDEQGNTGKTHLTTFMRQEFGAFTPKLNHKEAAYLYGREPLVVFDIPRHSSEFVPYGLIEDMKNGYIWSTKYEPVAKEFEPPIVIVFSNFQPELEKLSSDRWRICRICNGQLSRQL